MSLDILFIMDADYFISPNNRDDGMIENLLIEAVNYSRLKSRVF